MFKLKFFIMSILSVITVIIFDRTPEIRMPTKQAFGKWFIQIVLRLKFKRRAYFGESNLF